MANNSFSQQRLALDPTFHARVRSALATVAFQVIGENPATEHHDERKAYAQNVVLPNTANIAVQISPWLVNRTNLFAFPTSYDVTAANPAVETAAGDADIESQISTDWNVIAGI
jgi:hypothetical protein